MLGVRVTVVACDIADRTQVAALLAQHSTESEPVRPSHAAGIVRDAGVEQSSPDQFAEVLWAQVDGALVLDDLLADTALDAFVSFSSVAGIWGSGPRGLCRFGGVPRMLSPWRGGARGRPATTIAWGPWADAGISAEAAQDGSLSCRGVIPSSGRSGSRGV